MLPWNLHLEYGRRIALSFIRSHSLALFAAQNTGAIQYILVTMFNIKDMRDYRMLRSRRTDIREKFVENFIGVATAPFVATGAVAAAVPG